MPVVPNTDYTFTPGGVLIHIAVFERLKKLFEKAQNRDPDTHDMYIYNDFFGYAILDLVDETLSSIRTFVTKKRWLDAWHALDALDKFGTFGDWQHVDDGERVKITEQVYGALLVTTIRELESAMPPLLNEDTIPDLEMSLMSMASSGEAEARTSGSCYHKVLKGYGKKLFGTRSNEERECATTKRKTAYEAFIKRLSTEERKERGDRIGGADDGDDEEDEEDEEEHEDEGSKTWYRNAKAEDAALKHPSLRITSVWKEYKTCLAQSPSIPMRGPPVWDLTKWSAADRRQFSLDAGGEFSDDEDVMGASFS